LSEQRVRGPRWTWLVHRDSENDPLTRQFCAWLEQTLATS
jgi:LysR family glycine cleavage system transcriptional activator